MLIFSSIAGRRKIYAAEETATHIVAVSPRS